MVIKLYETTAPISELRQLANDIYADMVKAVVDIQLKVIAVGGLMHADWEQFLLDRGSKQEKLWGFNIFPDKASKYRLQYNSLINIRPRDGNLKPDIQNEDLKNKIKNIVDAIINDNA